MSLGANAITIQLPQFEGPLDLLLYLIRKEEMDILDIEIQKITSQYLEYIKVMKELDLEKAGEFVAMAATLLQIKSKMLLPQYDENGEIVETEDPRKELVQRLLEYQKYQEASKALYERPLLGRDVWSRGIREKMEAKEEEIVLEENALFSLISAYRRAVKTAKKKIHQVTAKLQSIASRIMEIKDRLIVGQKVALSELITSFEDKRKQVLITFLSALELGKMGFVSLFQSDNYQEIYIEARVPIESAHISKVEEYDHLHSENIFESEEKIKQEELLVSLADVADSSQANHVDFESADEANIDDIVIKMSEDFADDQAYMIAEEDMASDEEIQTALEEEGLV